MAAVLYVERSGGSGGGGYFRIYPSNSPLLLLRSDRLFFVPCNFCLVGSSGSFLKCKAARA
jgi:hypothetical protein